MLPVTFDTDTQLRISKSALGIFAVALLTAGFSFSVFLCFAVQNPLFQADAVYLPTLSSCAIGLLTVFYDFLISGRYHWNTPALLVTITAALSTIIYAGLLIFTHRKISTVRTMSTNINMAATQERLEPPFRATSMSSATASMWQEPTYYDNYVRNMFPASSHPPPSQQQTAYDPNAITEEEMQRQQMLMLLLQRDQMSSPDPSASTFHIDWQGQEGEEPPANGYYGPQTALPQSAYPQSGISRRMTGEMQPWDGVWRGITRSRTSTGPDARPLSTSHDQREARRREIEMGR